MTYVDIWGTLFLRRKWWELGFVRRDGTPEILSSPQAPTYVLIRIALGILRVGKKEKILVSMVRR